MINLKSVRVTVADAGNPYHSLNNFTVQDYGQAVLSTVINLNRLRLYLMPAA